MNFGPILGLRSFRAGVSDSLMLLGMILAMAWAKRRGGPALVAKRACLWSQTVIHFRAMTSIS